MVDPHADPIELVPSRYEAWRAQFEAERERIEEALTTAGLVDRLHRIEHVGSTAVPDLAAKDIVDVDVVVADDAVRPVARAIAGRLDGDRFDNTDSWNPVFRTAEGQRFNDHVFARGGEKWRVSVATRAVLRARPDLRASYADRKRELAAGTDDLVEYSAGKTDLIERILREAREAEDLSFEFDVPTLYAVGAAEGNGGQQEGSGKERRGVKDRVRYGV